MKSQRPDTGRGGSRGNWSEQRQQQRNTKPGNPEKRKVYVAGIGPDAKDDDIRRVFKNYAVEHVYMRFEGEKKAHCFVVFSTEAEAQEVLQEPFMLNNRPITVKAPTPKPDTGTVNSSGFRDQDTRFTGPKEQSADKEKEVFVANLPNNIEEENIVTLFENYGVEKVVLKRPENRKPFAFVTLRDKAAVAAAVNKMNNHLFWGKKLSVALSGQKGGAPSTSSQSHRSSQNGSAMPSESGAPEDESWDKPLGPPVLSQPAGVVDSPPSDDPPPLCHVVSDHGQGDGPPALVPCSGPPPLVCAKSRTPSVSGDDMPPLVRAGSRASAASSNGPAPLHRMTNGAPLLDGPPTLARISGQEPHGITAQNQVHEVFVGNLRAHTTEDEIRDIFAKYGVVSVFMKGRPPKPVAFVGLESAASVENAIRDLDGNSAGTQTNLAVRKADGPKPKGKPPKTASTVPPTGRNPFSNENKLFVANLPKQVTKDDVIQLFDKYGVHETFLISTKGTPYAFVTLTTEAGFNQALEEMQDFLFRGCKLFIGFPASRDGDHSTHPGPRAAAPPAPAAAPAAAVSKSSSPVTLCVANFPPETKMTDIAELFSSWDPLEVVMGRTDPTGQHCYAHAYVTVASWDEAEDAVFTLSETYYRERIITVAVLPEKCKRPY